MGEADESDNTDNTYNKGSAYSLQLLLDVIQHLHQYRNFFAVSFEHEVPQVELGTVQYRLDTE